MSFELSFTNKEITPWGAMVFLKQMLDKIDFKSQINSCESLPSQNLNRAHDVDVILESFMTSVWCGANRFLHTKVTRHDKALAKIFNWRTSPSQDAYKRYFSKFDSCSNVETAKHFFSWFFKNIHLNYFILDIYSTVMTRFGEQQGAKRGYNPSKRGGKSQHPIIAFVNDIKMVANFWLRSGDTSSANNFISFLEDTLSVFGDKKVGLIRLDSGFFQKDILDHLESKPMNYIIAAKFTHPVQRIVDSQTAWLNVDEGIQIDDTFYQAKNWEKPRGVIIVRQKISKGSQTSGKTLSLLPEDEIHRNYRYSVYVTNLEYGAYDVWKTYRGRGDAENRIKELKQDFTAESLNLKNFYATQAALLFVMISYNLMALFRMFVLQEKIQKSLSTLRYRTFAIGAYFEKVNNTIKLKIALLKRRRKWFVGLWDYPLDLPLEIPNA